MTERTRLKECRRSRGLSQQELARQLGISRQAVAGMEAGRWSPSLELALAISQFFHTSVEALFGSRSEPPQVVRAVSVGSLDRAARVALATVAGRLVAVPLTGDSVGGGGFGFAHGVVQGLPGDQGGEYLIRPTAHSAPTSVVVAGCDPALPLLGPVLASQVPSAELVWWKCGSALALELARKGLVHAAGIHLGVDQDLSAVVPPEWSAYRFASWREGLVLAAGVPEGVSTLTQVASRGLRLANREVGSQARRLLEERLGEEGVSPEAITGYSSCLSGHMEIAGALCGDLADVGVATEAVALSRGLRFVPWRLENFVLVVNPIVTESLEFSLLRRALDRLDLSAALLDLPGYQPVEVGQPV